MSLEVKVQERRELSSGGRCRKCEQLFTETMASRQDVRLISQGWD